MVNISSTLICWVYFLLFFFIGRALSVHLIKFLPSLYFAKKILWLPNRFCKIFYKVYLFSRIGNSKSDSIAHQLCYFDRKTIYLLIKGRSKPQTYSEVSADFFWQFLTTSDAELREKISNLF